MEKEIMSLQYSSAILNLVEANPSFDKGKLRIAYTGKNRNGSFISKEAFENAVPSMFGVPVVANYLREENEIGSHDGEFVTDEDGNINYVNITQPVGFVPPGAEWAWEIVNDNGVMHQYLTSDVILWKRQEAYKKIKENGITDQSMAITVEEGNMCDDYYNITKFYFTAFCLLGTAEPCFESAALFTFDVKDQFKKELSEMFEDFKLAFNVGNESEAKEGDAIYMDKLHELLEKYGVSEEELSFEIDGLSDEDLEAKFIEVYEKTSDTEGIDEEITYDEEFNEIEPDKETDFRLSGQVRELLSKYINSHETVDTEYGTYPRYYMVDFDESVNEVYFEDCTNWNLYGSIYTYNGDDITVDFENAKRKRYAIVDFVEGEEDFSLKECIDTVFNAYKVKTATAYEALEEKYNAIIAKENKRAANELFDGFEEKLSGDPEFEALRKSSELFDIQELEEKLYSMVGKKQFKLNTKQPIYRSPKAPVIPTSTAVEGSGSEGPYGDLFSFMTK